MKPLILAALVLGAAQPVTFAPTSTIWLEGDSTLHRYHSTATRWSIRTDGELRALTVEIKALEADRFPTIRFAATHGRIQGKQLEAAGQLTVAGSAR